MSAMCHLRLPVNRIVSKNFHAAAVVVEIWRDGVLPAVYGAALAGKSWDLWQQ